MDGTSERGHAERTMADTNDATANLTSRKAEASCLSMDARKEPEFNMKPAKTNELDNKHDRSDEVHSMVPAMNASDAQEFDMATTCLQQASDPESMQTNFAHTNFADQVQSAFDVRTPQTLAIAQLINELQLTDFPPEWEHPFVQPLLMEVLHERAKKIEKARSQRQKRREHRRLK